MKGTYCNNGKHENMVRQDEESLQDSGLYQLLKIQNHISNQNSSYQIKKA